MRFGIYSIGLIFLIIFLVLINSSQNPSNSKIDQIFEGVDANVIKDLNTSDANLSKFMKYTVSGVIKEFHGGYYFAAWLNTFLPRIVMDNLILIIFLIILALIAPLLWYVFLALVFIVLETRAWFKKRKED